MLEILIFVGFQYCYDVNVHESEEKESNISNAQSRGEVFITSYFPLVACFCQKVGVSNSKIAVGVDWHDLESSSEGSSGGAMLDRVN